MSAPIVTATHFLKSARVGITVALIVFVMGVAGEVVWLAMELPGVHRTTSSPPGNAPATAVSTGSTYFDVKTVSESTTDLSLVPTFVLAGVGLIVGFWRASRRDGAAGAP
jgi:hypothetical protein